jgi:ABC-type Fe3+ transport system permease subunit
MKKIATEPPSPVKQEEWREHIVLSLQQANHGLLGEIAFAGLMVFAGFGVLSGLGKVQAQNLELTADVIKQHGPLFYAGLMVVTCLLELIIYLRVRVAIGNFSLQLDPTDRPFRPLKVTDSLLGYMLLAFLFTISLHVFLTIAVPSLSETPGLLLGIDAGVFLLAVLAEQMTLVVAGRKAAAG